MRSDISIKCIAVRVATEASISQFISQPSFIIDARFHPRWGRNRLCRFGSTRV